MARYRNLDRQFRACLETITARNVPFYRKHGFDVVVEEDIAVGLRVWTMRRHPR